MDHEMKEIVLSQEDRIVTSLVFSVISILKDNLETAGKENELWNLVNHYLVGRYSLEFIKSKCSSIPQDEQKLKLWILLEISAKTLDNMYDHIAVTEFISLYKIDSCLRDKFLKILELCKVLQRLKYKINGRLPMYYDKYVSEQEIKDASFLPISKVNNSNKSQIGQQQGKINSQVLTETAPINYQVMPSIADVTPTMHTPQNSDFTPIRKSLHLSDAQASSIKIDINHMTPITRVVEESQLQGNTNVQKKEEDKTGRNNNALDLKTLLNMHNTNGGRSSNTLLGAVGIGMNNRGTLNNKDSTANLLLKHADLGFRTVKIRPSQHLQKTKFETITEKFSDKYLQPNTLANQKYQCFECSSKISKGLYIIGVNFYQFENYFEQLNKTIFNFFNRQNNAYFCNYTGNWYCYNCIATDKKPIPWKAVESFDLASYKISKKAEKEILSLYAKPILQFEYDSDLVQKNQILYDFMILKRQLYLLYDTLCHPEYLEGQLQNSLNLLIKPNIFSLKNFYDINNGSLTKQVEETYKLFLQHIDGCDKCQKNGRDCTLCNKGPKLFVFDIKNTCLCDKCLIIYHRSCLQEKDCEKCQQDG